MELVITLELISNNLMQPKLINASMLFDIFFISVLTMLIVNNLIFFDKLKITKILSKL